VGGGLFPGRNPKYNWNGPVPGWEKEAEWGPLLTFDQLPQMTNPPGGLIVQCNNSVFSSARPSPISSDDYPQYRASRGNEIGVDTRAARVFSLFGNKSKITWDDHMGAALDVKALAARPLLDVLLAALRSRKGGLTGDLKQAGEILSAWDGMATLDNRAVPILSHVYRLASEKGIDLESAPGRAPEILDAAVAAMKSLYGSVSVPMSRVQVLERGAASSRWPA